MKVLTRKEAYELAQTEEKIDFGVDGLVHPISTLTYFRELSARTRYQHPANANHSPGLGCYYWLQRHKQRVWVIWRHKTGTPLREKVGIAVSTEFAQSELQLTKARVMYPEAKGYSCGRTKCYYTQVQIDSF